MRRCAAFHAASVTIRRAGWSGPSHSASGRAVTAVFPSASRSPSLVPHHLVAIERPNARLHRSSSESNRTGAAAVRVVREPVHRSTVSRCACSRSAFRSECEDAADHIRFGFVDAPLDVSVNRSCAIAPRGMCGWSPRLHYGPGAISSGTAPSPMTRAPCAIEA